MDRVLNLLRAAAEPTRLRLLALCAVHELTVTELTVILGQSQPRVSRHLKLMCEGGLLERVPEGNHVFYGLAQGVARRLVDLIPADDPTVLRDRMRLQAIEQDRERSAAAYFARNAQRWDAIRSLHVPEHEVEARLLDLLDGVPVGDLLDIGTGTGRILEVLAGQVDHAVGVDLSREMLTVARVNLERAKLRNCSLRHGDIYALPFTTPCFDLVVIHQALHYLERPAEAIAEAARVLRPDGRLLIIDFAPHAVEQLREAHAHRRLGFNDGEVQDWLARAGLTPEPSVELPGDPLTVTIWPALAVSASYRPAPAAHKHSELRH